MKKVIDGKLYNTDTATLLCDVTPLNARAMSRRDFDWEDTNLYRTTKGRFFIAGEGGPNTRWQRPVANGRSGGDGLVAISEEEAKQLVEQYGTPKLYAETFGAPEEA